jgi:hypothetical protein
MSDYKCTICDKDCKSPVILIMHVSKEHPACFCKWSLDPLGENNKSEDKNLRDKPTEGNESY